MYADKPEYLYEIMLKYATHFRNPINLYFDFFNKFISYSIKKNNFSIFQIGLTYIKDIETFINVIGNNKVDIYDYYNSIIDENNIINNIQEKSLKKVFKKIN